MGIMARRSCRNMATAPFADLKCHVHQRSGGEPAKVVLTGLLIRALFVTRLGTSLTPHLKEVA